MTTYWELEYKQGESGSWTTLSSMIPEATAYYDQLVGLTVDEVYYGRVRRVVDSIPEAWSQEFSFVYALSVDSLAANDLAIASPVLDAPTLAQIHALVASGLTVSGPALGTPTLTENAPTVDNLTADSLVVGSPVLGAPFIGQVHVLTATGATVSAPVLGTPALVGQKGAVVPAIITASASVGMGGIKGALGIASFTASAALSPSGTKAANGYVSFSSASEFGVSGILEQFDDKVGTAVFVNESIVGASGAKNALGGFGISNNVEFGASGVKGVLMPELSQASGVAVSSSEISGSVYTNKNTGTLYAVATLSSTKPSVAQIQAGQNHLGASAPYATSQAVTTYGLQSVVADGLTFNTQYYWHFQHNDGEALDSTVITSAAVRTADLFIVLDFPATAPCSLLGYQVWSKLTVTDEEIAALWGE